MLNCQGSFVLDNNHSEGWNKKSILDIGRCSNWWGFLWKLKQYFALIATKYEAFQVNGFTRKRSGARQKLCKHLEIIWNKFDKLDRTNEEIVWKYVNCLYLCYEKEYEELNILLDCI